PGPAGGLQRLPDLADHQRPVGVSAGVAAGVPLAWWGGVDGVVLVAVVGDVLDGVGDVEPAGVVAAEPLGLVDACDVPAGAHEPFADASAAAECVEHPQAAHDSPPWCPVSAAAR